MKPLSIDKALELYDILHEHLPEFDENAEPLEFIGKIVEHIKNSKKPKDYLDAISIMTGLSENEIIELGPDKALQLFIEGLSTNKIVSLQTFAEKVGYHARN